MNNTVTFIYLLKDPITLDIKYIGKSDDPNNRLTEHIRKSKYKNTYKNNWINGLLKSGNLPIMEIIDVVEKNEWKSLKEVSEYLLINRNTIRMVCNNQRKSAGGYKWKFKQNDNVY